MKTLLLALILIVTPVVLYSQEIKKIEAEGCGFPYSKSATLEIQKQEAFVAAIIDAVRGVAEQIEGNVSLKSFMQVDNGNISNDKLFTVIKGIIGDFFIDSQVFVENFLVIEDIISCKYKDNNILVRNGNLMSPPVEFLSFPKWHNLPKNISGIEIKSLEWKMINSNLGYSIKASYSFDLSSKIKSKGRQEARIISFDYKKDKENNFIYETVKINGKAFGGGDDTPDNVRKKALDDALRNAVEKINGVFIQVLTEVKNMTLTKDEIISQTIGVAKVLEKKFSSKFNTEGNFEVNCSLIAKVPIMFILTE
ncbi:MAG: hypothetical protein HQK79_21570 [Desulfobacterales bacterium]|nr:hypothetical protein [Desulfobacterales bacterium]